MNDRIRFICSTNGAEWAAIHRVNEQKAMECHSPQKFKDSLVGICSRANDSIIIRLREIPMLPNEMSYKSDHNYFFITTSTGDKDGLENNVGGLCRTNNMRLKIRVESKRTTPSHIFSEITIKNAPVMMIPVHSGSYVPVVYVPVSTRQFDFLPLYHIFQVDTLASVGKNDKKRPIFPYPLHFENGQLRTNNSNFKKSKPGTLFDVGDEPKVDQISIFGNKLDDTVVSKSSKDKAVDFEVEYMDSASKSKFKNSYITVRICLRIFLAIKFCFSQNFI
ncbi:unnamed protein product [Thelazia callipaeda]|uniref:Ephrin RBD domain-containing protein n=1 Tax=Thelazia callipaeda TaxID=103827 RepID=A0A0N5CPR2_THECL|nr:unnamed protein product [Thelazia callipaeda]